MSDDYFGGPDRQVGPLIDPFRRIIKFCQNRMLPQSAPDRSAWVRYLDERSLLLFPGVKTFEPSPCWSFNKVNRLFGIRFTSPGHRRLQLATEPVNGVLNGHHL